MEVYYATVCIEAGIKVQKKGEESKESDISREIKG